MDSSCITANWRRSLRRVFAMAGVKGGHPHRFRDTFAVELLLSGVPLDRVSVLLGHGSIKITEKHYTPLDTRSTRTTGSGLGTQLGCGSGGPRRDEGYTAGT